MAVRVARGPKVEVGGIAFTAAEARTLRLIVDGMSDKAIARSLGIAPNTVKDHLRNIFGKIGVDNRTRAAVWAARNGVA